MNDADSYFRSVAKMTRVANEKILKKLWSSTCSNRVRGQLILDIGCGDGSSTMQVLKPFLGGDVRLEASDISASMVHYANNKYLADGVKFFVWDVQDATLVKDMANKYDKVYSFYCLQYTKDLRKALQNIYDILKPGGSFFFVTLAHLPYFEAFKKLALYPKWAPYLMKVDLSQFSSPFQNEPDPVNFCTGFMVDCGFENVEVKHCPVVQTFESWEVFLGMARFGDRFADKLPEELRENYMKDFVEELKHVEGFFLEKKDECGRPYFSIYEEGAHKDIIGCGVKPHS